MSTAQQNAKGFRTVAITLTAEQYDALERIARVLEREAAEFGVTVRYGADQVCGGAVLSLIHKYEGECNA
jgi:hypothetical protein